MIYKYIRKKCFQLSITDQCKQSCILIIQKYASKKNNRLQELTKADIIIKICQKLIKFAQGIQQSQIDDGLKLLEFIKSLTMDIYQNNRIQAYFIKIRAYLLTLKWNKGRRLPIDKPISRVILFLLKLKCTPIYEAISSDYYCQLQRLYLQVIENKLVNNQLDECNTFISACFESFKAQIAILCNMFNIEDIKINKLINIKLQLLAILFKFEHGIKFITNIYSPEEITGQITPKYERITLKIPITHFPNPKLLTECQQLWRGNSRGPKTINNNSVLTQKRQDRKTLTKEQNRQSLKQTVQYLNDFFKKRSHSATQLQAQETAIQQKDDTKVVIKLAQVQKKSFFQVQNKRKENTSELILSKNKLNDIKNFPKKKQPKQLIQVKKFKLVINMEREQKQRILTLNPFSAMTKNQLSILTQKQGFGNSLVFYQ